MLSEEQLFSLPVLISKLSTLVCLTLRLAHFLKMAICPNSMYIYTTYMHKYPENAMRLLIFVYVSLVKRVTDKTRMALICSPNTGHWKDQLRDRIFLQRDIISSLNSSWQRSECLTFLKCKVILLLQRVNGEPRDCATKFEGLNAVTRG